MIDRLRLFLGRPLTDRDRTRLFALAVAAIVIAASGLALLDDTGSKPRSSRHATTLSEVSTTPAWPSPVAASEQLAPSEESAPPVGLGATPVDIERSKRAARRFLAGYLPFTYGNRFATAITAATPELRLELARQRPRAPAGERRRRPRLELLQASSVTREHAELVAIVDDGQRRYSVGVQLTNTAAGWLVTSLGH